MDMIRWIIGRCYWKKKLANDTVIVFTGDNGGVPDKWSKTSQYNHTTNGPSRGSNIYSWSGYKGGQLVKGELETNP